MGHEGITRDFQVHVQRIRREKDGATLYRLAVQLADTPGRNEPNPVHLHAKHECRSQHVLEGKSWDLISSTTAD